jgi:hypothetical protein
MVLDCLGSGTGEESDEVDLLSRKVLNQMI